MRSYIPMDRMYKHYFFLYRPLLLMQAKTQEIVTNLLKLQSKGSIKYLLNRCNIHRSITYPLKMPSLQLW